MNRRTGCTECSNHVINPEIPERMCDHDYCETSLCESKTGLATFKILGRAAPLWIEGHVEGIPFYFRLRHERWRIEVLGNEQERGIRIADGTEDDLVLSNDGLPLWGMSFIVIEDIVTDWIDQRGRFLQHGE